MPLAYSVINQELIKVIVFQLAIFLQIHHSPSEPNSTDLLDLLTPSFALDWELSLNYSSCLHREGQYQSDIENNFFYSRGIGYKKLVSCLCMSGFIFGKDLDVC